MKKITILLNLLLFSLPVLADQGGGNNNGYSLVMPQPSALNVAGSANEVQGFSQYYGDLYIGYHASNRDPSLDSSPIYKWNGTTETPFYILGKGVDFDGVGAIQAYSGKLYFGNQAGYDGSNSGCIYANNPNAIPVNFIQSVKGSMNNPAVTVSNDSNYNAIYGATSFSIEYYGRMDDLGGSQGGQIIKKAAYPAGGYALTVGANNTIMASIYNDHANNTKTNANAFTLGNYHDIIFSWTSGSYPIIYIDGIAASLASSKSVTTPGNDTSAPLNMSDNPGDTYGSYSYGGTYRRVRIWRNYALSSSDASTLALGGVISRAPTGQYLFKEGSGMTTADSSGNGNTGTITPPSFWNSTKVDLAYCSGNDRFIYGFAVFNGNLYAGAGYSVSRIYSYNGTTNTWATAYPGLPGYGLVVSMYVFNGRLFAALGGSSGAAIISTADGVNWVTEVAVPHDTATEFDRFVNFGEILYAGVMKGPSGIADIYKRDNKTGTWSVVLPSVSPGQVWGMDSYNNALYVGGTTSGGATIYKSIDGINFTQDFQVPNAEQTEAFNMINYNGAMYIGIGFGDSTSGVVYRKIEPIVNVITPIWGSNFAPGSNVTLTTTASETGGTIANISLYNAGGILMGSSTSSPYDFIAANLPAGKYTYYATATDINNFTKKSNPMYFTVTAPVLPSLPQVVITSPVNGSSFTVGSNVTFAVTASEAGGAIANISLYNGWGVLLGSSTSSPYNYLDTNLPAGPYTFYATAKDANGVTETSSSVGITVK